MTIFLNKNHLAYLFASIYHIFWITKTTGVGSSNNRVMSGRRMRHFHRGKLKEGFTECHPAHDDLAEREKQ